MRTNQHVIPRVPLSRFFARLTGLALLVLLILCQSSSADFPSESSFLMSLPPTAAAPISSPWQTDTKGEAGGSSGSDFTTIHRDLDPESGSIAPSSFYYVGLRDGKPALYSLTIDSAGRAIIIPLTRLWTTGATRVEDVSELSVSPDGKRLALQVNAGTQSTIWVISLHNQNITQVLAEFPTIARQLSLLGWTADGHGVVFRDFGDDGHIWVTNLTGYASIDVPCPVVSLDSVPGTNELVYVSYCGTGRGSQIWKTNIAKGQSEILVREESKTIAKHSLSPDASKLAYVVYDESKLATTGELLVLNLTSGTTAHVAGAHVAQRSPLLWESDSRELIARLAETASRSGDPEPSTGLAVIQLLNPLSDGNYEAPITKLGEASEAVWVDGQKLLVAAGANSGERLSTYNLHAARAGMELEDMDLNLQLKGKRLTAMSDEAPTSGQAVTSNLLKWAPYPVPSDAIATATTPFLHAPFNGSVYEYCPSDEYCDAGSMTQYIRSHVDHYLGDNTNWKTTNNPSGGFTRWDGSQYYGASLNSCSYGKSCYPNHEGTDYILPDSNADVLAAADGNILFQGWQSPSDPSIGYGYHFKVGHARAGAPEYSTIYGHLQEQSSCLSDLPGTCKSNVSQGERLGTRGTTGNSTGDHLHFGVKYGVHDVDPYGWQGGPYDPLFEGVCVESPRLWLETISWCPASTLSATQADTFTESTADVCVPWPPSDSDTQSPNAVWISPDHSPYDVSGSSVHLEATASDDSSGMQAVVFSAKWNGVWHGLDIVQTPPYTYDWDMCLDSVPDGVVELGLEAWDVAGNHFVYSSQVGANYLINKQHPCTDDANALTGPFTFYLLPSESVSYDVTFLNSGNTAWLIRDDYMMKNEDSGETYGLGEIEGLNPGYYRRWHFDTTAPSANGTYTQHYRMYRGGTAFGEMITVTFVVDDSGRLTCSNEVLVQDDFSDSSSGWPSYSDENRLIGYNSGEYQMLLHPKGWSQWAWPSGSFSDYLVAVDVRFETSADGSYGILFEKAPDTNDFYLFEIGRDSFSLWAYQDSSWVEIVPWQISTFLNSGPGSQNRIEVRRRGEQINLFANGHFLQSVTDDRFPDGTQVGLYQSTWAEGAANVDARFDNFEVRWCGSRPYNRSPYFPSDPSPANNATNVPVSARLSWTGGDPDAEDGVTYEVYLGTDTVPTTQVCGVINTTSCSPGFLHVDTNYYWQVVAIDGQGATSEGPIWHFRTAPCLSLSVSADPSSAGTTSIEPPPNCTDGTKYLYGTSVTMRAEATSGYRFSHWSLSDGIADWRYDNPAHLILTHEETITARLYPVGGQCSAAQTISCGESVSGNNSAIGSTQNIRFYSCSHNFPLSGPEFAYRFTPTSSGSARATLSQGGNLALFVLDGQSGECEGNYCYSSDVGLDAAEFTVEAGRDYYLLVDGFYGYSGDYTLGVECSSLAILPSVRIADAVDASGERDVYRFDSDSAQWISVRMFSDGGLDPYLELKDSSGVMLTSDDDGAQSGTAAFFTYLLPNPGPYQIIASGSGATTGEYRLGLAKGRSAGIADINHDCVVDEADIVAWLDCWTQPAEGVCSSADIDLDGQVEMSDMLLVSDLLNTSCPASPNLLTNSGFEEGTSEPTPWVTAAWDTSRTLFTWDGSQASLGSRSVKISSTEPNDARWTQTVDVIPGVEYRLSGCIKTENVTHTVESEDAGANLSVMEFWGRSAGLIGTHDWTCVEHLFNSDSASQLTVAARLGYYSGTTNGTAWFDDLRLELAGTPWAQLWSTADFGGTKVWGGGPGFWNDPNADSYSLRLPAGWSAKTWRGDNRSGEEHCWTGSEHNLEEYGWQSAIQSIEVFDYNACPPAAVADLKMSASATGLDLVWSHMDSNVAYYQVYRSEIPYFTPGQGDSIEPVANVTAPSSGIEVSYPDSTMCAGENTPCYYAVVAISKHGIPSTPSNRVGMFEFPLVSVSRVAASYAINQDNQDGFEDTAFRISGDGSHHNWVGVSASVMAGWIFPSVNIPRGATIIDAYVRARGFGNDGSATTRIYGFAQDDAEVFAADGSNKPSTRPITSAFVDWPKTWKFEWQWIETPNFAHVLQEIVDRPGWSPGHNVGVRVNIPSGTGTNWCSVDYAAGTDPTVLHVTYSTP